MKKTINTGKISLLILIMLIASLSFVASLFIVITAQSKVILAQKIEGAVQDAEKLSQLDASIPFERALKIHSGNLAFSVFKKNCDVFFSTDLLVLPSDCLAQNKNFEWRRSQALDGGVYLIGYSSDLFKTNYLIENKQLIYVTSLSYLVFVLVLTLIFFTIFIERPIQKISVSIAHLLETKQFDSNIFIRSKNKILGELYSSISKLTTEVIKYYSEQEKHQLSQQIAHDLRAPLSVLEEQFPNNDKSQSIESIAIRRIRSIAESLMPSSQLSFQRNPSTTSLLSDLAILYPQMKITLKNQNLLEFNRIAIREDELFRFLTNIIKNSVESGSTEIEITFAEVRYFLIVSIKDNGEGISSLLIPEILKGHTTKQNGNGLGLSGMHLQLTKLGGRIEISSSVGEGFSIELSIPYISEKQKTYILIDDDKIIRMGWEMQAKKKDIELLTFASIDEFIKSAASIKKDSHIYVDSDLGRDLKGEMESECISKLGFENIFLATGYSEDDFSLERFPWIKGVRGKKAPFE